MQHDVGEASDAEGCVELMSSSSCFVWLGLTAVKSKALLSTTACVGPGDHCTQGLARTLTGSVNISTLPTARASLMSLIRKHGNNLGKVVVCFLTTPGAVVLTMHA